MFITMDLMFWRGMYFAFVLTFKREVKLSLTFVLDLAQALGAACFLLDTLQLMVLVSEASESL